MDTIIVATDFSKAALNASKYAAALAAELKAHLIIVHIIEVPLAPLPMPLTAVEFEEIEKSVSAQLAETKEQLLFYTNNRINIITEIKYGFAETALENLYKQHPAIAIVVGLRSNAPASKPFLGSTALRILPYLDCPVLIIPEKAVFAGIKNIVIASDSEQIRENTTIESIKNWLSYFHVQPDLVHVNTEEDTGLKTLSGNVFLHNRFSSFSPRFHSIHSKNVDDGIFGFLEQKKTDLLIVVPGKYSFLRQLFHASHSKQLILHSHLPVLAVPSRKAHSIKKQNDISDTDNTKKCAGCDGLCCSDKQVAENQKTGATLK